MEKSTAVFKKELISFLSSPVAFVFFGAYLLATLFSFFWVEKFFARNLADIRPLFDWMPVLMIFLASAITMRMWSEEKRSGTIELLLTSSAEVWQVVLGKFFSCLFIVGISLVLTSMLPVTVDFVSELDWGPVFGGYAATLFLASAYIAIGLYVSSRVASQIESLVLASMICGFFYILGTDVVANLFGQDMKEVLRFLAPQVHFESIMRGVVDVRDIFYYLSLTGVFLCLNVYQVDRLRGSSKEWTKLKRLLVLIAINLLVVNIWLSYVGILRADLTEEKIYSVSSVTRDYMMQAREPLLIRGYFSSETHPLLAPLVPRIRDLLAEYKVAGEGKVNVELVDPIEDPDLEREANERFGIKPIPFQFASKYQSSVVNSYFNILISYGDEYEILGFRDLISVKAETETDIRVDLRNPEYDITQAIKKVIKGYAAQGSLFEGIEKPVTLKAFVSSAKKLPESVLSLRTQGEIFLKDTAEKSDGKFSYQFLEPEIDGGKLAIELGEKYGFQPMTTSYFSSEQFWFYLILESNGRTVFVELPEDLSSASLEKNIRSAIKKYSAGFMKTVGLLAAKPEERNSIGSTEVSVLRKKLSESYLVEDITLSDGVVPNNVDLLLLLSPERLNDKALFAVDQFVMRGGTIIIASAPFNVSTGNNLSVEKVESGLEKWLLKYGLAISESMVLDESNMPFPVPVDRDIGGFTVRETKLVDYPYFVDIRGGDLSGSVITNGFDQVTLSWASPIELDENLNKDRKLIRIMESSDRSWSSASLEVQPDYEKYGDLGFPVPEKKAKSLLGVAIEGRFESFFIDRINPLVGDFSEESADLDTEKPSEVVHKKLIKSPVTSRVILFSSNTFVADVMLDLASSAMGTRYERPADLLYNAVDWSLEESGLLSIRGRGQFVRTLPSFGANGKLLLEYFNYFAAFFLLFVAWYLLKVVLNNRKANIQRDLEGPSVQGDLS